LRENVRQRTPLGIQAEHRMKTGALVPDSMIVRLILNEIKKRGWVSNHPVPYTLNSASTTIPSLEFIDDSFSPDRLFSHDYQYSNNPSASFILDGFPRNAGQASQIDNLIPINMVVHIDTPAEVVIERIANRWVHAPSGRVYNTTFNPPKVPGKDDVTGEPLTRRADDCPETWKERLRTFEETSMPLLEHYDRQGVLYTVKGNSSDEITPKLIQEFARRFASNTA